MNRPEVNLQCPAGRGAQAARPPESRAAEGLSRHGGGRGQDLRHARGGASPGRDAGRRSLTRRISLRIPRLWRADWRGFAAATAVTGIATAVGWPLYHHLFREHVSNTNILMLYLLGVLWVATRHTRGAAVLASVLGVAAFDFCFVPPYLRLAYYDRQYLVTFAVMLLTALVISTLTHRVRMQAEVARQAWERVEAEFLRNTLLSGVSHELRTPLAAITGAVSSILETGEGMAPASRAELLQTIYAESERMERLITNLLDMTRLESGGLRLKKEWAPLHEVVGSVLHHLDRRLRGRALKTDLPADLPLVLMDGPAIEQVLTNLVDNAVEYTPIDSPIEIVARVRGGTLVVEVADRGPGLPPGTEARVFDKFFRAGDANRGIGLGLAISRGIVEAHGGTMSADNRAGGGACFRMTLPLDAAPPVVDSTA
jgi:two-component system sensor histidine kinase KdpD